MPVVFPGFSWFNMYGRAFNLAPRLRGRFPVIRFGQVSTGFMSLSKVIGRSRTRLPVA